MRHRVVVAISSAAAAIALAAVTLALTASPALAGQLPVVYNGIYGFAHASPTSVATFEAPPRNLR